MPVWTSRLSAIISGVVCYMSLQSQRKVIVATWWKCGSSSLYQASTKVGLYAGWNLNAAGIGGWALRWNKATCRAEIADDWSTLVDLEKFAIPSRHWWINVKRGRSGGCPIVASFGSALMWINPVAKSMDSKKRGYVRFQSDQLPIKANQKHGSLKQINPSNYSESIIAIQIDLLITECIKLDSVLGTGFRIFSNDSIGDNKWFKKAARVPW